MTEASDDFEQFRQHIQDSLNGDLGDEAQEEMILALFEGQLKHEIGCMNIWAGNGVGCLTDGSGTMIWS